MAEENENKVFTLLENYLMGPMGKMASWKFVRSIMAAGVSAIPFIIAGSMFLVLNVLPDALPFLEGLFDSTVFKISELYMLAHKATMGVLGLYFGIVVGYEYTRLIAEEEELNLSSVNGALLAMFAFFMTIPQVVLEKGEMTLVEKTGEESSILNGWEISADGVERLGASAIFAAIIMAILAVQLYKLCVKYNLVIKLPEQVPDGVSKSFSALIPAFVIAFAVFIINGVLITLGLDIFKMIEYPFGFVVNLTDSWLGVLVIVFLMNALWVVGIHGPNIINGFVLPVAIVNMQHNIDGANIPYAGEFLNAFIHLGGSGATLGLCLFMLLLSQSQQLKILGKASIVPSVFNINEPIIFGLPVVYNPYLFIPFILAPMVAASIAYWATKLNLMGSVIALMPFPIPIGAGGFISTGGSIGAVLIAIICALAAFVVWFPFIKIYDKKLLNEEKGEESSV